MKSLLLGLLSTSLCTFALSPAALSNPLSASAIEPQPGEIALEGTVISLRSDGHGLQLRATAFSTPRGGSQLLATAKSKAIQTGATTRILDTDSGTSLALKQIQPGALIRVIGKEGGSSKPFIARLIAFTPPLTEKPSSTTTVKLSFPPDPDTPPALVALLPQPQLRNHYILTLVNGGFKPSSALFKWDKNPRPVFFTTYTITDLNSNASRQSVTTAEQALKLIHISGPDNQPLDLANSGPFYRSDGSARGTIVAFRGVRPEWKSLKAVWEMLDPAAPATAKGEVTSLLTFHDVPAPQEWDKRLSVNQTQTTPRGTKLTIESVHTQKLPPNSPYKGTTFFNIRSTAAPDAKATFDFAGFGDDKGTPWKYTGWGKNSEGNVDLGLNVDALPDPVAKTMTVTVKVTEKVPALRDPKYYYRFEQEIPVAALFKAAPLAVTPDTNTVLARAESPQFTLEVERNVEWDNGGWNGLLWVQNRNSTDADSQWLVRSASARGDKGESVRSWTDSSEYDHRVWHLNGRSAIPQEHSIPLILSFSGDKPNKVDVDVKLEAAHRVENWSWLRDIPLPAPGKSLELKTGQKENDFLSIKRLFWFKSSEDLPGLTPQERQQRNEGGLAVVVEQTPLFSDAEATIKTLSAFDDQKRLVEGYSTFFNGDAGRAGVAIPRLITLVIPMLPGSKTVDLWLNTVETKWQGRPQTLTLHDIPTK